MTKSQQNPQKASSVANSGKEQSLTKNASTNDSNVSEDVGVKNKKNFDSSKNEKKPVLSNKMFSHKVKEKKKTNAPKGHAMVSYDSKTHSLKYSMQFTFNGIKTWTQETVVDLQQFDEKTRQFMIALAKQSINFANGHKIASDCFAKMNKELTLSSKQEDSVKSEPIEADAVKTDIVSNSSEELKNLKDSSDSSEPKA